jgi:hypothetical protein
MSRHHEFAMYLVADDAYMMLVADVAHALQLFSGPYATCGIVRVAQEKYCSLLVGTSRFEVIPIYLETALCIVALL